MPNCIHVPSHMQLFTLDGEGEAETDLLYWVFAANFEKRYTVEQACP